MEKVIRIESRESSKIKSYKDLIAWQKSMSLITKVYKAVSFFPKEEVYGISSQIKRSVISIASNIAEGSSRRSIKEFLRFINIARGSISELETQLIASKNLGFIKNEESKELLTDCEEISRILQGLYSSLDSRI